MPGLHTRLSDDSCSYKSILKQSTSPLNYQLQNFNTIPTHIRHYGIHSNIDPNHSINTFNCDLSQKVNVEHNLLGVNKIKTKCPELQFPNSDNLNISNSLHNSRYVEESSRLTNPLYNYRGMTINRFINLGVRPTSVCQNYAESTRITSKDEYKIKNKKKNQ